MTQQTGGQPPSPAPAINNASQPARQAAPNPAPTAPSLQEEDFLWKVHGYVNDYIRFADTKEAAVIAWCASLIGAMFAVHAHHLFMKPRFALSNIDWEKTALGVLSASAFLLLGLAIAVAFLGIAPRLWPKLGQDQKLRWYQWGAWPWVMVIEVWKAIRTRTSAPQGLIFWENILAHGNESAYGRAVAAQVRVGVSESVAAHICFASAGTGICLRGS